MSTYGTTNATPESAPTRDAEQQALLNHRDIHEANDTFYGRTFIHVHTHRKRYFALWLLAAVTAVATVLVVHYAYKQHKGHDDDDDLLAMLGKGKDKPDVCHSDRSYPVAILLSIFFGYVGIDRFYLGYVVSSLLKLITAGGFGIWYIVDIVLIVIGGLPDHNGCQLI
ncbi:hypothetical protein BGZ74_006318 [Mortierella antarctica]|nr:hypothetical protein BGZ74_006318 [Mortierella antarctica]